MSRRPFQQKMKFESRGYKIRALVELAQHFGCYIELVDDMEGKVYTSIKCGGRRVYYRPTIDIWRPEEAHRCFVAVEGTDTKAMERLLQWLRWIHRNDYIVSTSEDKTFKMPVLKQVEK